MSKDRSELERLGGEPVSRRSFLKGFAAIPVIGAVLAPLAAAGQFAYPPASLSKGPGKVPVKGGAEVRVGDRLDFNYDQEPYTLFRNSETEYVAVSRVCTHLGCTIAWQEKEDFFECPCHGARFDRTGKVLRAPANGPLARLKVTIEGAGVLVEREEA